MKEKYYFNFYNKDLFCIESVRKTDAWDILCYIAKKHNIRMYNWPYCRYFPALRMWCFYKTCWDYQND